MKLSEKNNSIRGCLVMTFFVLVCTVGFSFLKFGASGAAETERVLKIGAIFPLTGAYSFIARGTTNGFLLAAEDVNAAGGFQVGGVRYKLKVLIEDDALKASNCPIIANKLIHSDKVDYIFGPNYGAGAIPVRPIINENKKLQFAHAFGRVLSKEFPYTFRDLYDAETLCQSCYGWYHKAHPELRRVAILNPNHESGWSDKRGSERACKAYGKEIVYNELFELGTKIFTPFLLKIKSANPDMLDLGASSTSHIGLIAKQARELGIKAQIVAEQAQDAIGLTEIGGDAVNGIWFPTAGIFSEKASLKARESVRRYTDKFGEYHMTQAFGQLSIYHLIWVLQNAGTVDSPGIIKWIDAELAKRKPQTLVINAEYLPGLLCGKGAFGIAREIEMPLSIMEQGKGKATPVAYISIDDIKETLSYSWPEFMGD